MSLELLLNQVCNIYHQRVESVSKGYGIPNKDKFTYSYLDVPDLQNIPCHFVKDESLVIPFSVDIQYKDKIIDLSTGVAYIAQHPKNIRNHHKKVKIEPERTYNG